MGSSLLLALTINLEVLSESLKILFGFAVLRANYLVD